MCFSSSKADGCVATDMCFFAIFKCMIWHFVSVSGPLSVDVDVAYGSKVLWDLIADPWNRFPWTESI